MDPCRQMVAQAPARGVVRVLVAGDPESAAAGRADRGEQVGGAAPAVEARDLEVGDLDGAARPLADLERLPDGLGDPHALVPHVRVVAAAVAGGHAREGDHLVRLRIPGGRAEEPGREAEGARRHRLLDERRHPRELVGRGARASSPMTAVRSVP